MVLPRRLGRPSEIRFCIFAQGRTGSTLLTSLLDSHPEVRCRDEILRRPRLFPLAFACNMARGTGRRAFGFHVKIYQLTVHQRVEEPGRFLRSLTERSWRLVHLTRRDPIAHAFSNVYARHVRRMHFDGEGARHEDSLIWVDPADFVRRVRDRLRFDEAERRALAMLEPFRLVYEDDLVDPYRRALRLGELQDWLGLVPRPLQSDLTPSVRRSPWELMANADAVRAALSNGGYAGLVDQGAGSAAV
jgi:LPS sulfotransferase NodH